MNSAYVLLVIALLLFFISRRKKVAAIAAVHHIKTKNNNKERKIMEELAKEFIGMECIIYTVTSNDGQIQGTIKDVGNGGILLEDMQGNKQIINLEYVTRLREYPRNKKGKKKSVVMD